METTSSPATPRTATPPSRQTPSRQQAGLSAENAMRQLLTRSWLFGRTLAFSIDEESVQTAVASHFGSRHRLISSEKLYLPTSATAGPNRISFLCDTIDRFVHAEGKGPFRIVLVLSGLETAYRELNLPALTGKDLQDAIHFEARKALPFPDNEVHYGYRVLGRGTRDGRPRLRIGVTGCLRRSIENVLEPFDRLKLSPAAIWSTQDALSTILPGLTHFQANDTYALLNVEKQRSEISFYVGNELQFSHLISLGSSFLSNRADLTMFEYFAEALAGEIQNSIDYYTGSHTFSNASQVYIYGNLAYSDEIISLMGERLGFAFRRFPVEGVPLASQMDEQASTSMTISLGVTGGAITNASSANLLPADRLMKVQRRSIDQRGLIGIGVLALGCALLSLSQMNGIDATTKDLIAMQAQAESLKASPLFATFDVVQRSIQTEQTWIDRFGNKQIGNTEFLRALGQITPAAIRLYLLQENHQFESETKGHFETYLSAIASELEVTPEIVIHDFVRDLSLLPGLESATVTRYQKQRNQNGIVEIDFQILIRGIR